MPIFFLNQIYNWGFGTNFQINIHGTNQNENKNFIGSALRTKIKERALADKKNKKMWGKIESRIEKKKIGNIDLNGVQSFVVNIEKIFEFIGNFKTE